MQETEGTRVVNEMKLEEGKNGVMECLEVLQIISVTKLL